MTFFIRNTFLFILLCSIGATSSIAQNASKNKKTKLNNEDHIQNELESKAEHKFIKGMGYFLQQDFNSALKEFKDALELNPENAAVNYKIAETYYLLNFPIKAISYAKDAVKYKETNKYYHILLSNIYMDGQEYLNAAITYERMLALGIGGEEYYFDVAEIYQQLGVNELKKKMLFMDSNEKGVKRKIRNIESKAITYLTKSLQAYTKLDEKYGITPEITYEKQKIHLVLGEKEKAYDAGIKLIDAHPENLDYKLSLAEIYHQHESSEKAINYLKEVIEIHPDEAKAYLLIYQFLSSAGRVDEANEQLQMAFSSDKMPVDSKVKFISSLIKIPGNEELALNLANETAANHPEKAQAHSIQGDVLYLKGDINAARKAYKKALSIDKEKILIWEQIMLLDSKSKNYELLIDDSKEALTVFPKNSVFWFYQGLGFLLDKKFEESVHSFEAGLPHIKENSKLKIQFLANLGDAYNELGNYPKSDSSYNAVIENDPNNTRVLNNYSYYLSLRNERLEEAEAMIVKAVRMHPTDPTYLDTYGWVLYKLKKYSEALVQFEKALLASKDATIIEHYGDTLYQLGRTNEALAEWKKAKENGLESEIIDKKIADGKIYE